jgi:hypothetical protein
MCAAGKRSTNEQDYAYTRAALVHFSQRMTNEEAGKEPLMTLISRGDKEAQSAVMSHFIKTKEWSRVKGEVKWPDISPDLQWSAYFACFSEFDISP